MLNKPFLMSSNAPRPFRVSRQWFSVSLWHKHCDMATLSRKENGLLKKTFIEMHNVVLFLRSYLCTISLSSSLPPIKWTNYVFQICGALLHITEIYPRIQRRNLQKLLSKVIYTNKRKFLYLCVCVSVCRSVCDS